MHILSILDIKKMIPIVDGVYSRVNINPDDTDTNDVKKYKDLLISPFGLIRNLKVYYTVL